MQLRNVLVLPPDAVVVVPAPIAGPAARIDRSRSPLAGDRVLGVANLREVVESASRAQPIFDGNDRSVEDVAAFRRRLRFGIALGLLFDPCACRRQRFDQALQLAMTFVSVGSGRGVFFLHEVVSV